MKRRAEHLVRKRDGRSEFLRATKLARSIHLALHSVGIDEDWRALELANVVLQALRQKREPAAADEPAMLTTVELADAVQHVLVVTGQAPAAVAYGAVGAERARRRSALLTIDRAPVEPWRGAAGAVAEAPYGPRFQTGPGPVQE